MRSFARMTMTDRPKLTPFAIEPWPFYAQDEIDAVSAVIQSGKVNYWTGEQCQRFEEEYAHASGCQYGVAVANGTAALELALHALDIPPGSEVITSPRTFIASASCAAVRGCIPVLAEVDPNSGNITADTIAQVITERTRAIIVVHLAGWPCEMDAIMALAEQHGIKVIEDCAQASGATYRGSPVGSLGHVGAFSFCQDKNITTLGEGGMLVTNDKALWERAWSFKDHGKSHDAVYGRQHAPGFRWLHESFGTNLRMLEVQAAVGRLQLRKLPDWIRARVANARRIAEALAPFKAVRVPMPPPHIGHAWYKFYAYVRPENLAENWSRDRIMEEFSIRGMQGYSGSCSEIYLEKAFTSLNLGPIEPLPVAHEMGASSLMFLIHPTLSEATLNRHTEIITEVLTQASGR
jgi:dTDP-4-amino-4,6-dideoxygalactose transaminase